MSLFEFITQKASLYVNEGAYTVIPVTSNGIFNLPFHFERLKSSYCLLNQINEAELQYYTNVNPIKQTIRSCDQSMFKFQRDYPNQSDGSLSITWGVNKLTSSFDVDSICLPRPFQNNSSPGIITLAPFRKRYSSAKYISWLKERSELDQIKKFNCVEEVILYHDNILTEGLTSNFFYIDDSYNVVDTSEPVLNGCIRQFIFQICTHHGFNYLKRQTNPNSFPKWKAAFITNAVKRLKIIHSIKFNESNTTHNIPMDDRSLSIIETIESSLSTLLTKSHEEQSHDSLTELTSDLWIDYKKHPNPFENYL